MEDIQKLFDLSGKVALVTGGSDGIGRGVCMILAAAGAAVVVTGRRLNKAQEVADEINRNGDKAIAASCDVLKTEDLEAVVKTTVDAFGSVNILINNAGMGGGGREDPFNIDLEYVEKIYRMNVFAPWLLCKLCVPYMQESGYGAIVNISSMSSIDKQGAMGIYGSSKAALNHLAEDLAFDFGPRGVRINNVGPGATRTTALSTVLTPEIEEKMLSHTPIKRLGEVSDIARAVLFFASPASSWITGQTLFVNGGGSPTLD